MPSRIHNLVLYWPQYWAQLILPSSIKANTCATVNSFKSLFTPHCVSIDFTKERKECKNLQLNGKGVTSFNWIGDWVKYFGCALESQIASKSSFPEAMCNWKPFNFLLLFHISSFGWKLVILSYSVLYYVNGINREMDTFLH